MWYGGWIKASTVVFRFGCRAMVRELMGPAMSSGLSFKVVLDFHKSMCYFVQHNESCNYTSVLKQRPFKFIQHLCNAGGNAGGPGVVTSHDVTCDVATIHDLAVHDNITMAIHEWHVAGIIITAIQVKKKNYINIP